MKRFELVPEVFGKCSVVLNVSYNNILEENN